jgi:hypothetical protein
MWGKPSVHSKGGWAERMTKEFQLQKVSSLQREFTIYVFSSLRNNWNYVRLPILIGTKNNTGYFWPTRSQKQPMAIFVSIKLNKRI